MNGKIKEDVVSHLRVFSRESDLESNANVLIIGNAYGVMPYIAPLATQLSESGYRPFWFAFSGQGGTPGEFCFESGVRDIEMILHWLSENHDDKPIRIVSHCAGSLLAIEYLSKFHNSKVDKMIIYGLLFSMQRRRRIAERRLRQSGVKYNLSEADWAYSPLETLSALSIPILFTHASDELNIDRASVDEINSAVAATSDGRLIWHNMGYDNDLSLIREYIDEYVEFLS